MKPEWIGQPRTTNAAVLEARDAAEAYHQATFVHVEAIPQGLDPSGLVPYPCEHGVPVKPARYPKSRYMATLDEQGNERPPFGGRSWGRPKYLLSMEPLVFEGKHVQFRPRCVVCLGEPVPADFHTTRDGFDLRAEEITL